MIIDENNIPNHIKKLFDYIIAEVFSSGGDGDCDIICKNYDAENLSDIFYKIISAKYPNSYYLDKINDTFIISDRSNESWSFHYADFCGEIPIWAQCVIKI